MLPSPKPPQGPIDSIADWFWDLTASDRHPILSVADNLIGWEEGEQEEKKIYDWHSDTRARSLLILGNHKIFSAHLTVTIPALLCRSEYFRQASGLQPPKSTRFWFTVSHSEAKMNGLMPSDSQSHSLSHSDSFAQTHDERQGSIRLQLSEFPQRVRPRFRRCSAVPAGIWITTVKINPSGSTKRNRAGWWTARTSSATKSTVLQSMYFKAALQFRENLRTRRGLGEWLFRS